MTNVVEFELGKRTQETRKAAEVKKTRVQAEAEAEAEAEAQTIILESLKQECNTLRSFMTQQKTSIKQDKLGKLDNESKQGSNQNPKPKSKGGAKTLMGNGQGMWKNPPANHPKHKPKAKRPHPDAKAKNVGNKPRTEGEKRKRVTTDF